MPFFISPTLEIISTVKKEKEAVSDQLSATASFYKGTRSNIFGSTKQINRDKKRGWILLGHILRVFVEMGADYSAASAGASVASEACSAS